MPRFLHYFTKQRPRHVRQANEHGRVVPVVLGEEESVGIELYEDVPLGDGAELEDENGIIVAEAREETTTQEEGWQAIRPACGDVREREQEAARVRNADPTRGTGSGALRSPRHSATRCAERPRAG